MRVMTITTEGQIELHDADPTLEWLQEKVDGWIEPVTVELGDETILTLYVNEEGKITGLDRNPIASRLAHHYGAVYRDDWVAGNVVILGGVDAEGETMELPEHAARVILTLLTGPDVPPARIAPTFWQAVAEAVYAGVPSFPAGAPGELAPPEPS